LKFKTNPLGGATRGPVADVFDIMKVSDQWDDVLTAKYVGTAFSDAQIAMSLFEQSWYVLDHTCFDDGILAWALNGESFDTTGYYGGCNTDIQLHINKGVIGLRIDNIVGFTVDNVQISNLKNTGVLGTETEVCGAYTQGNAHQDPLITAGYTGTEGYGITITQSLDGSLSNINIDSVETYYGASNGIALFKDSQNIEFNTVTIDNIIAGSRMQLDLLRPAQNYLPNKIPTACSIFDNLYNTQYTITGEIVASNVNGYLLCSDEAMIGDCATNCDALYEREYFDELAASSEGVSKKPQKLAVSKSAMAAATNTFAFTLSAKMTVLIIAVIAIAICLMCHYLGTEYTVIAAAKNKILSSASHADNASEITPLLQ
jgi:hypothetical protein